MNGAADVRGYEVAELLTSLDLPASYQNTGGGIMCIVIEDPFVSDRVWYIGDAAGNLGYSDQDGDEFGEWEELFWTSTPREIAIRILERVCFKHGEFLYTVPLREHLKAERQTWLDRIDELKAEQRSALRAIYMNHYRVQSIELALEQEQR